MIYYFHYSLYFLFQQPSNFSDVRMEGCNQIIQMSSTVKSK